jgi:hypothetical protein
LVGQLTIDTLPQGPASSYGSFAFQPLCAVSLIDRRTGTAHPPTSAAQRWPRPTASRAAVALSRNPWPRRTRSRSTTNGAMPRRRPRSLRPLTELGPGHACGHRRLRLRHRHLHLLLVMYAYMHSPAAGRILICTACARSVGAVRATHPTTLLTQPCATRLRSAVSAVRLGVRFPRRFPQPNASTRLPPPPPASFLCREVVRVRHRDFSDSSAGSPLYSCLLLQRSAS